LEDQTNNPPPRIAEDPSGPDDPPKNAVDTAETAFTRDSFKVIP